MNRIFHATLDDGRVFGVAADRHIDARQLVHARLVADGCDAPIVHIDVVGRSDAWAYGLVLAY